MISRLFENIPKEQGRRGKEWRQRRKITGICDSIKRANLTSEEFENGKKKKDHRGRKPFPKR